MRKTRDLFKKIRDIKGTFHVKDRNSKDLAEAKEIKKRWQEYTEELQKKRLNDLDNHDGVVTHLELGILQCEVKWASGNNTMNKASRGFQVVLMVKKPPAIAGDIRDVSLIPGLGRSP